MIHQTTSWLATRLANHRGQIKVARIFGSLARGSIAPSDCDVLIVSRALPESADRHVLRGHLSSIGAEFFETFALPLSVLLLTLEEFESENEFVQSLSPYIDIMLDGESEASSE